MSILQRKRKAWIILTVNGMSKLSLTMLVVLEMANATASSARRSVPAEEIIAKVQNNQPVEYDNVTISGDLDLGRLNPATVRSEFSIVDFKRLKAHWNDIKDNVVYDPGRISGADQQLQRPWAGTMMKMTSNTNIVD